MTATNVRVQMQQRRDTAANWTAAGPTLLAGEIGYETDTGKIKIGDGTTAWASLAYLPIPDSTGQLDDDLTITGDLTVQGTTTTIESTTLTIEDKNIELAVVASPTDITADGGGITLKGATDKTINWVDATDAWTFSEHVDLASAKEFRINGTKVLDATSLGSAVVSSSLTSVGTIGTGTWQGSAVGTAYGGTGQTTYSDGELLIGKTDGTLAKATITQGSGVTITNGDGTIEISATGSGGSVTSVDVSGGTGLTSSGGPITTSGTITIDLDNTAVTPGSYTYASLTVDQQGRITAASSGTAPLTSSDIGTSVQPYDANTAKYDDTTANFTGTLQNGGSNVLVDTDIDVTVQGYDADTAKYDDTTANFTGTLQNGGSNVLVDTDIGVTVQGYDADTAKYDDATANFTGTLQNSGSDVVVDTDIGVTVQAYDADTAKYDDTTANFTGTLQNGGSDVVVDTDIGVTVQAYDADTAKLDVAQTFSAQQTFGELKETVYTLGTSGSIALDPANGSIQSSVLTGAPTFTDSLEAGQTIVLMLENGASYTVTWPSITWVTSGGNAAPTLTAKDTLVLWKVSTTLYGAYVGSYV